MLALPALLAVYTLLLIPFTPSIADITKAKTERPAQLLCRWTVRCWPVPLGQPRVGGAEPHLAPWSTPSSPRRTTAFTSTRAWTSGARRRRWCTRCAAIRRAAPPSRSSWRATCSLEEIGRSRTITRKLKEAITAFKIEVDVLQDEILETYLNTVPFLYNAYGIEMAARTYFDKSADKLNLLESATLIGMLKGTAYYNPVTQPEALAGAAQHRAGANGQARQVGGVQAGGPAKRPLRIDFERQTEAMGLAPHFAQQLRKQLIAWADANGYSLHADGLIVRTTIDSRLQAMANQAVARQGPPVAGHCRQRLVGPQRLEPQERTGANTGARNPAIPRGGGQGRACG